MNFKNMKNAPQNFLFIIALAVIGIGVLTFVADQQRQSETVAFTEFLDNVEQGKVNEVRVEGQDVYGQYTDGSRFETTIAANANIWDSLRSNNVTVHVGDMSAPITIWHIIIVFAIAGALALAWYFARQGKGSSSSAIFSMGKSKAKMFLPTQVKERFDSVAGADDAKEELKDVVDFLKNPDKYRRLGADLTRGVLLVGEPGNGKTLLAKAVAGEANCPFFSITGSDFMEVFVGVGASRIRDLFDQARKHSPCIVFIDEIDAIGRQRGSGMGGGHDEREQTLNQLLTEMDGFTSSDQPIIVIGSTNAPQVLDKALLRPGRFDRRIEVPYPGTQERRDILDIHTRKVRLADDVDFGKIADVTAGYSAADLANLVNQAAIHASKYNKAEVTQEDFDAAHTKLSEQQEQSSSEQHMSTESGTTGKMYTPSQVKTRFPDVAGLHEAKEELEDVVDFLKEPEKYYKVGAYLTRGALLVGDPGNGKTLLARAVAGEANRPFFSASGSDFIEKYVGVGAARVRDLFAQARKHSPSIVFIDEIDALGARRSGEQSSEHSQTLNQLLAEIDGFDSKNSSVVVMAATNRADILDPALIRPGRFDRRVDVPYPDIRGRKEILDVHAKKVQLEKDVDLHRVARGTPGFRGADLAHLVNEAAINAVKQGQEEITIDDFEEARDKVLIGKPRKSIVMNQDDLRVTAYHEAGHALLLLMQPNTTDPLHKITIMPRGDALGVTSWLPERDKYSEYRDELVSRIIVSLGGRVAEEIVFGNVTTGAYGDFQSVTEVARQMVCYYGMSQELGSIVYPQGSTYTYSEETARKIDEEVRTIVDSCYNEAKRILQEHHDKLEKLAEKLLERETMYAQEVYELLDIEPRTTLGFREE